jgi:hypothetical protein
MLPGLDDDVGPVVLPLAKPPKNNSQLAGIEKLQATDQEPENQKC